MVAHAANEIEGFLFQGRDAERAYHETGPQKVPGTFSASATPGRP